MVKNQVEQVHERLCSNESPCESKIIKDLNYSESIDRLNRIVGFYSMKEYLQPRHKYFNDKKAYIIDFKCHKQKEHNNFLMYPVLGGLKDKRMPRENPMRKYQLARSHTSRKIKMIIELIKRYGLSGFKCSFLTLTMPKEISLWLSYQEITKKIIKDKKGKNHIVISNKGNDIAWRMFGKFWEWYDGRFGPNLAGSINLHTWKSEIPLEPHYHYHCLIPNYMKKEIDILDNNGDKCYTFEMQKWHKQRGGTHVPVSENELLEIKMAWWHILVKVCKKHKIDWEGTMSSEYSKKLDIHYAYAQWFDILGKIKLMHWFNYQGRYPLEDYAKYSNKHTDCPYPSKWLEYYENHNRAFGWWKEMKQLAPVGKDEKIKINPVTGERMEYFGRWTIYEILKEGNIGFLEVIRGSPVFHRLRGSELAWLLSVQRDLHPAIERSKMDSDQAGYTEVI